MSLHVALLEPLDAPLLGAIARHCAAKDAPLHVVGPLSFGREEVAFGQSGAGDGALLDLWVHPGWRAFRDAMSRERCLYFAADAEREADEAPFRGNSVLVLGDAAGTLPAPILGKYPGRIYRLPMPPRRRTVDLGASVELLLELGNARLAQARSPLAPPTPTRYGRGRGRR